MMTRRIRNGWLGTAFAFLALGAGAIAQIHPNPPIKAPTPHPIGIGSTIPAPRITLPPGMPSPKISLPPRMMHLSHRECEVLLKDAHKHPGTSVPARCFTRWPRKTAFNTITSKGKVGVGHYRPAAATGATLTVSTVSGCSNSGDLYNNGCKITVTGTNLGNAFTGEGTGDTLTYYVLPPNFTTTSAACGGATAPTGGGLCSEGAPGANCTSACSASSGFTMNVNGVWMAGVYDSTERDWLAVVYINVGTEYNLAVYQDPFHTQQAYQYDVNSSGNAYIQLTNVVPTDKYVVYVMSTAVRSYCVYLTPAGGTPTPLPPTPRPTGSKEGLLCDPSIETGTTAPGGTLNLTWALSNQYEAGSYSIVAYDQTAQTTLSEVQVSLTASSSNTLVLYPTPSAAASPAAPSTPANTKFAWDNTSDQSDAGIVAVTATAEPTGNYTWTVQDPNGVTVAVATPTNSSVGAMTQQFNFTNMSPAINSPGYYANNIWVWQLYNRSTKSMVASQAFQMVGYSTNTQFCTASCTTSAGGTLSNSLSFANGGLASANAALVFTNNANTVFPNASDNIAKIVFTTGPASTLSTNWASTLPDAAAGSGGALFSFGANQDCYVADGGCSQSETDSNGNSWTAKIYCSEDPGNPATAQGTAGAGSGVYYTSQCVMIATPVSAGTYLTPGASLVIEGSGTGNTLTWYVNSSNGNWPCHSTACSTVTSELPADGVSWSSTSSTTSSWNAVQYGTSGSATGTVDLSYMGTTVARATAQPAPTGTPWPAGHYYNANFNQADYYASKPFSVSNHFDILDLHVNNTGSLNFVANANQGNAILAITFPSYYTATSVAVDSLSSAAYQICNASNTHLCTSCPSGFGPSTVCLWGANINSSSTGDIYLDVPLPTSSFAQSEAVVQVSAQGTSGWTTLTSGGTSTAVVGGGNSSGLTYDGLALAAYDLDNNLISAGFNPSTVGTGSNPTAFTVNFTNPSTGSDPNPDPIDLVVVEQTTASHAISGTPTFLVNGASNTQASGWSYLGTYNPSGNNYEYWFGVCASQFTNRTLAGGTPPQTPPSETNPSTTLSSQVPQCTTAQEANALKAGDQLTINMSLASSFSAGSFNFYGYAHGANEGGWSGSMTMPVTFASEAATNQFFYTSTTAPTSGSTTTNVTTNTIPFISDTPNYYIYEITNTSSSATTKISTIKITVPAFDINGLSASDGTYSWNWKSLFTPVVGTISGGKWTNSNSYGCTYNSAGSSDPVAGSTNGTIEIDCTNFAGGSSENIAVEFKANAPQTESSTYQFPVKIDANTSSAVWTGADEIEVLYSLGLSVVVDPSNPGPGGSTPTVSCSQCSFSGTTINFGIISTAGTSVTGTDVARASVVVSSANVGHTWNLSESVNANTNNLFFMQVDKNASSSAIQSSIPAGVQSFFAPSTSSTTLVSGGPESSVANYDTIMSYKICTGTACGASANDVSGHTVVITYTLVGN